MEKPIFYLCFCCGGDGKETCNNPDHGFLSWAGGDVGRIGCPVCGHDPEHKVPNGGACECCDGKGYMNYRSWHKWAAKYKYDDSPEEYTDFVYVPSPDILFKEYCLDLDIDNLRINNRIRGLKLLNNDFLAQQFTNLPAGIKKMSKCYLHKEIKLQIEKEMFDVMGNYYKQNPINFYLNETETINYTV